MVEKVGELKSRFRGYSIKQGPRDRSVSKVGTRYLMLTRKVEIHISRRANKKLLSPRALSFARERRARREGTMTEEWVWNHTRCSTSFRCECIDESVHGTLYFSDNPATRAPAGNLPRKAGQTSIFHV